MVDAGRGLVNTHCAICLSDAHDTEVYPANVSVSDLTAEVFSARRQPDRIHYRMVRCLRCGLMRANPILSEEALAALYSQSHFTYAQESAWAAATYFDYFARYLNDVSIESRILEIGGGNGSFLKLLHDHRFRHLSGIEPSQEAIVHSGEAAKFMRLGMFAQGVYPAEEFDVIAGFQVFDHVSRPNDFLKTCNFNLKEGGKLFLIMHDEGSLSARLLGERSPIVDIEHTFLYNRKTLSALLKAQGFKVRAVFNVTNKYPLRYWVKIMPAPKSIKERVLNTLAKSPLGQLPCSFNAGNMGIVAVK